MKQLSTAIGAVLGFYFLARPVAYGVIICRVVLRDLLHWHEFVSGTLSYPYTQGMYRVDMFAARVVATAVGGVMALWIYRWARRSRVGVQQ